MSSIGLLVTVFAQTVQGTGKCRVLTKKVKWEGGFLKTICFLKKGKYRPDFDTFVGKVRPRSGGFFPNVSKSGRYLPFLLFNFLFCF